MQLRVPPRGVSRGAALRLVTGDRQSDGNLLRGQALGPFAGDRQSDGKHVAEYVAGTGNWASARWTDKDPRGEKWDVQPHSWTEKDTFSLMRPRLMRITPISISGFN